MNTKFAVIELQTLLIKIFCWWKWTQPIFVVFWITNPTLHFSLPNIYSFLSKAINAYGYEIGGNGCNCNSTKAAIIVWLFLERSQKYPYIHTSMIVRDHKERDGLTFDAFRERDKEEEDNERVMILFHVQPKTFYEQIWKRQIAKQ